MEHARIEQRPGVLGGKPVIRGTRMPVWLLLQEASFGRSVDEIVAAYPTITADDVRAAFAWAAEQAAEVLIAAE